jgi:hypothetical protein
MLARLLAPIFFCVAAVSLAVAPVAAAAAPPPPAAFAEASMVALGADVLADPAIAAADRERLVRDYGAAVARVEAALGPLRGVHPLAIFCQSDPCKLYFAGPQRRSWTLRPGDREPGAPFVAGARLTVLVMRADPGARDVLGHELVHAELSQRLRGAHLPQWFHEGLASVIGGAPACPQPLPPGVDDLRRLDRNDAWADFTSQRGVLDATYCQARAEVSAWLARAGAARLPALVDAARDGAAFENLYGPMATQSSGPMPAILMSPAGELGDGRRPFSLALWVKATAPGGVVAHASFSATGVGWCMPLLGFDGAQRLVAQVIHGNSGDPSSYGVAASPAPLPLGRWVHLAMTWAPGAPARLYVDGKKAAEAAAPRFNAGGAESPRFITWGSSNVGGAACWQGAVVPGRFQGALTGMRLYAAELSADEIARLASAAP